MLGEALPEKPEEGPTQVDLLEELTETAGAVTDRIDHAQKLFQAATQGGLLDRELLTGEIGSLLELLQRLDKAGRYDEELRLARALHGLLVLTSRWLDLVRSLRMASVLRARSAIWPRRRGRSTSSARFTSVPATRSKPSSTSRAALALEERLGDAIGRCPTRHNLDSARRDLAQRGASLRLRRVASVVAALALVGGAGAAFALVDGSSPPPNQTAILAVDLLGGEAAR